MSKIENEVKNEEGKNDALAIKEEVANEIVKTEDNDFKLETFDIRAGNLPDIGEEYAEALPIDLMADYWTPLKEGESKRVFFQKLEMRNVPDFNTGELVPLECALFVEQTEENELKNISNGSNRLVSALISNNIKYGTPLLITYLGKRKNKKGPYSSDNWSIKPIIVKVKAK